MPRVQENAPGIRPSRSISRGSRMSTITTSPPCAILIASAALTVSISALASSIRALMPRWMVWAIQRDLSGYRPAASNGVIPARCESIETGISIDFYCIEIQDQPASRTVRNDDQFASPHQLLHRAFKTFDGDRKHALGEQSADDSGRFRIIPMALRDRIEPHRVRIGTGDALKPYRSGFLVDMLDRTAGHHDLVRRHRGVAHEYHLVVVRIFVQHVPSRGAVGEAAAVLLPHAFVQAVVEVEIFHVLEFGLCRGEQFLDLLDVGIHRAADVKEHQHLDGVAPLRPHMHVEITVVGGFLDGGVEIEFIGRASAGKFAQPPQRDLDVADTEFDIAVEVFELAAVPNFHRAEIPVLLLPDPHAFRVVTVRAERRGAGGTDPFVAALMPALLLLQSLPKRLHELVPAHRLDLLLFLFGEIFFRELLQPFGGDIRLLHGVEQALEALEHSAEHTIELVEIALVLYQRGARKIVEILHGLLGQVGLERLDQRQIFMQRDRDLRIAQRCEELQKHALQIARRTMNVKGRRGLDLPGFSIRIEATGLSARNPSDRRTGGRFLFGWRAPAQEQTTRQLLDEVYRH